MVAAIPSRVPWAGGMRQGVVARERRRSQIALGTLCSNCCGILARYLVKRKHKHRLLAVLIPSLHPRFSFYQRWFDTVFLLSGCATAATLLALHFANRNNDADHHDDHHTATSRIDATTYSGTMADSSIPGVDPSGLNSSTHVSVVRPRGRGATDKLASSERRREFTGSVRTPASRKLTTKQS